MARVTVEDCIEKIPNRFRLVLMAGHRARNIALGSAITIERDNDKNPVVALREIADETLDLKSLEESLISGLQRVLPDEDEEKAKQVKELEALPAPPPEMDEGEMLKALQNDRDGAPDGRL